MRSERGDYAMTERVRGGKAAGIEKGAASVKDWLPFKDIVRGTVVLKDGGFVRIFEVLPINFKLKSKAEKRLVILNFRSFLKACRFPMQILVQCRQADVEKYIGRMEKHLEEEKDANVKNMIEGHIKLVKSLGAQGAVSRRFFLVVPYVPLPGAKSAGLTDAEKQFNDKLSIMREHLSKCGNSISEACDTGFAAEILYTYLNKKTCETQKIGGKLSVLTGLAAVVPEEGRE